MFELFVHGDQVQTRELHELYSNQEESDTRVILYLRHAEKLGHESAIVRTPDSDLFFLLLYHSHHISLRIFLDVGVGKHRKIVDVSDLASSFCISNQNFRKPVQSWVKNGQFRRFASVHGSLHMSYLWLSTDSLPQ